MIIPKNTFTLLFAMLIIFSAHSQESASEYMSKMGIENNKIQNDTWNYVKASAHSRNARKVEKRRNELLDTMKKSIYNIRQIGTYKGDGFLRDANVKYLNLNLLVIKEDYEKIVDMEKIAEESYDAMEAYLQAKKEAGEKLSQAYDELDSAQTLFAAKYNINLISEQDKQGKKLQKASEVMDYYNKMYLIFFKSFKQEVYVLQDFKNGDLGAFEQNKNALNAFSTEGLKKIDEVGSFRGDPMIKLVGKKVLTFYQNASAEPYDNYSKMIVLGEKVQKISKYMESIKPSKRTQEDIDQYNAISKEYNEQVNIFNKVNNSLNKKRNDLLNEWNGNSEKFFAKHVPK